MAVVDSIGQIIELTGLIPSSQYYVDEGQTIAFTLFNLQNPSSCVQTSNFQVIVSDQGYPAMTSTTGTTLQASPGLLSNVKVEPNSYRTSAATSYSFSFLTTNSVPTQGQVFVTLPPELSVALPLTFTGLSNRASITYNQASRTISITNALPSGAPM